MTPTTARTRAAAALLLAASLTLLAWRLRPTLDPDGFATLDADLAALGCDLGHGAEGEHAGALDPAAAREALARVNAELAAGRPTAELLSQKVHLGLQVDVVQAIDACHVILARDPGNEFALGHLASAYLVQRQFEAALRYAATAVQRRPGPANWNLLATVLLNQDRLDQAESWFRKSLEAQPGQPDASRGIALIAARRGAGSR